MVSFKRKAEVEKNLLGFAQRRLTGAKMKKSFIFSMLLVAPAMAENGPSFDCAKAGSSAEELVCREPALAALDQELSDMYRAALTEAESLESGAESAAATLKAMQRGWIKGRDECWKSDELSTCVRMSYLQRISELTAQWMLREPYTEATWQCGGNPVNDVFVLYFDTELPAIRLAYGDGVSAMVQAPAASGVRYDGSFGQYFWEKGGTALFAWDQDAEQECVLVAG